MAFLACHARLMRRYLVVLTTTALFLAGAQPAQAEATAWGPNIEAGGPTFTSPIQVVDGARYLFADRPAMRRFWTQARNAALREWGLAFEVTQSTALDPYSGVLAPGAIALTVADIEALWGAGSMEGIGGVLAAPCMDQELDCGYAIVDILDIEHYFRLSQTRLNAVYGKNTAMMLIAHEIGHALGFNHGGTGVMIGSVHVNDQERTLAVAYYGPA